MRYNKTPYVPGETKDDSKYSTDPHHTGEEKDSETGKYIEPDKRVKKLHVTNFPKNIKKEASFGVVKQYIGKNWTNEVFNFEATPVKSKIGSESNYVAEGGTRKIVNYVHKETGAVISEQDYEALTPEEQENVKNNRGHRVYFPGDVEEYKELSEKYMEEERKLGQYRMECKNEALSLFSKWFYDLWD